MMKKIIPVLILLLFVGTLLISGCGSPIAPSDNGETDQVGSELGMDDLGNDLNTVDADDSDFDLSDVDNVATDLGDM